VEALRAAVFKLVVDNGALNRMEDDPTDRIMRDLRGDEAFSNDDLLYVNAILDRLTPYEIDQIVLNDETEQILEAAGYKTEDMMLVDEILQAAFEAI
jgi:hypothetical protein